MKHGSALKKDLSADVPSVDAVLQEAVDYLAEAFENSEAVDGADLVEWFGQWREQAKLALLNLGETR